MKILTIFLICLFPYAVMAQENALLWEISGNNLEQPSYLFGTIHILCPENMELSEALHDAFNKTDQLVLELDFDDPQLMASMQNTMMMTDGSTLSSLLETDEYALIDTYFKEEGHIAGSGEHRKTLLFVLHVISKNFRMYPGLLRVVVGRKSCFRKYGSTWFGNHGRADFLSG